MRQLAGLGSGEEGELENSFILHGMT